jgi:hypothetical protein
MKFLLYFIAWHDGQNHHVNIIVDTPPSRENIGSLREAIAKMALLDLHIDVADVQREITICNIIPLPDRIIKREGANIIIRPSGPSV